MHQVCVVAERKRERITKALNPYLEYNSTYFAQPKFEPKVWIDIHNLETIVQQLFTPKLRCRTYYDVENHVLHMSRMPIYDLTPKRFLPLSEKYLNGEIDEDKIDGASIIMEYNHPDTATAIETYNKHADQFNQNILQPYTYGNFLLI